MAFNIALSGLNAAQTDLDAKGNNIANASTTGFKRSRVEFGDLYSSGLQNLGDTSAGDGVSVQNTRQLFQQGNITATSNGLDMAIDGEGFFVTESPNGERQFTRSGQFGVDEEGFVTNNQGARVQGFQADEDGQVGDVRGDLEVNTENLAPKSTTNVAANLNLDSREEVIRENPKVFSSSGTESGQVEAGGVNEGFSDQPAGYWTINRPDGTSYSIDEAISGSNLSAQDIAGRLNQEDGLNVSSSTSLTLSNLTSNNGDDISINGESYEFGTDVNSLSELATAINDNTSQSLDASYDSGLGELTITDSAGANVGLRLSGSSSVDVDGELGGTTTLNGGDEATARGRVDFEIDEGYEISAADDDVISNTDFANASTEPRNEFNSNDPNTYNHSTSTTIYDSLGNPHEMTQYFVKQSRVGNPDNSWKSHVEIDGELVGNSQDNPDGEEGFNLVFQRNGSLDTTQSDDVLINDWVPKDDNGNPNGAEGPDTDVEDSPLPPDSNSSNFVLDYSNTTQVGSEFAVNDLQQNGFATGRLTGLDVSEEGVIQARFSNGESEALGQVALANFRNNEGLAPVGDTSWVETIDSGDAVISRPNTGPLGAIQSSSVEESNVDLSEQLVGLITAQRNFQANSKTIETSDQITQTIINLR